MRKFFLSLLAGSFFVFTACNNSKPQIAGSSDKDSSGKMEMSSDTKAQNNKQTTMAMFEAFNKHDVDASFKGCASDFMDYGDGSGKPMGGDSIKAFFKDWLKAFPDYKADNIKYVSDCEWVMVWADWSGTWKGDFMKQKATGKSFKMPDVDIFRFNDEGKIIEHHNIQPFATIFQQIGMKM